jgi:hypothetical protein
MELDDMKAAWALVNRQLEQQQALNLRMFKASTLDRAGKTLRPLWWGQVLQIIAGGYFMLTFAPYWVAHLGVAHLMVYGLVMHAYGLMLVLTAARNLYLQSQLDNVAPVLEIQRRLAALRNWRLREALLYGVTGCFVWIPFILLLLQKVGADVWVTAPSVVWWNIAASMACVAVLYCIVRVSRQPGRERLKAWLDNSVVGRSVRKTEALVDEIERFERAA